MTDWQRIDLGDALIDGLVMMQEGCLAWGGVEQHEPLLAGHRELGPLVWTADGTPLEVPDVTLHPAYPVVSVASEWPEDGRLTLALQTADGPQLWSRSDDGWTSVELPMGHLVVARLDLADTDRVWVVVDGSLWTGTTG
jgi:hypothetical protein